MCPSRLRHLFILILFTTAYPCFSIAKNTILVFGDSLSAGYGLEAAQDWPTLLNSKLKQNGFSRYHINNLSLSGETTSGGLLRFPKVLATYQPQIVIIALGANDGLRGQSLKVMKANLNRMIDAALAIKAKVIIAGMQIPPNYGKRYARGFQQSFIDIAKTSNVVLIPFLLEGIAEHDSLFQKDRLHPKANAQPIIANLVYEYLKPLLRLKE